MEPRRLAQYTRLCRKLGIQKLSIGDVTIELDLNFQLPTKPVTAASTEQPTAKDPQAESLSDEELLYWSTGPGGTDFPSI